MINRGINLLIFNIAVLIDVSIISIKVIPDYGVSFTIDKFVIIFVITIYYLNILIIFFCIKDYKKIKNHNIE